MEQIAIQVGINTNEYYLQSTTITTNKKIPDAEGFVYFDTETDSLVSDTYTLKYDTSTETGVIFTPIQDRFIPFSDLEKAPFSQSFAKIGLGDLTNESGLVVDNYGSGEFITDISGISWYDEETCSFSIPKLKANVGGGLQINSSNEIVPKIGTLSGLYIDSSGYLKVKTDSKSTKVTIAGELEVNLATNSGLEITSSGLRADIDDTATSGAYKLWSVDKIVNFLGTLNEEVSADWTTENVWIGKSETNFHLKYTFPTFNTESGEIINGFYEIEYGIFPLTEYATTAPTEGQWATEKGNGKVIVEQVAQNSLLIEKPERNDDVYSDAGQAKIIFRVKFKNYASNTGFTPLTTGIGNIFISPEATYILNDIEQIAQVLVHNPAFVAAVASQYEEPVCP